MNMCQSRAKNFHPSTDEFNITHVRNVRAKQNGRALARPLQSELD